MKIKEVTAMPLGKVTTVTPNGTDPAKSVVNIKTADGKDIQTTQAALIPGPNNTFQINPELAMQQAGDQLKPGATVTQTPNQGSSTTSSTPTTTATNPELSTSTEEAVDDGLVGGDATDNFIDDVRDTDLDKSKSADIKTIRKLAGL